MGWGKGHVHVWIVYMDVRMNVITEEDETVPFCAWMCRCGHWQWRMSPEVMFREGYAHF